MDGLPLLGDALEAHDEVHVDAANDEYARCHGRFPLPFGRVLAARRPACVRAPAMPGLMFGGDW
ncbi:MAG: hypothetical protein MUQ26_01405 [Armatimonadetes bacterium]|nr:hypothetical protein [Armatimonadota bacterium]